MNTLGYRGIMISQVGNDDLGKRALDQMTELGMETAFISTTSAYPTGTVKITLDEQRNVDFEIIPDVAYDFIEYTEARANVMAQADCVCFGTLAQRQETSRQTLAALLEHCSGRYRLYDINLRKECYTTELVQTSLQRSDILKLNHEEVTVVTDMYGFPPTNLPGFAASLFRETPVQICVVTLGDNGAFAASRAGEQVYVPAYKVELTDTCGAGDGFTAGFLHSLLQEQSLQEACRFGNALGAMVAARSGATEVIAPEEIQRFVQQGQTVEPDAAFAEFLP